MKKHDTIIIGAGLSGLTVAHRILTTAPDHSFLVIEKEKRPGGAIKSFQDESYIAEIGPHGFLDNCEESKQLLQETGLDKEAVKAPLLEFVRYVFLHGKLNLIPQTPKKIIMAPLISWPEKLRLLADIWKNPVEGEPTIAKWVANRFGSAMLPYADAVFTGTYAGDIDELRIDAVMPGVRSLEKQYGSLIRSILARMWQTRKEKKKKILSMPSMTSFPQGMERLTDRLAEIISEKGRLLLECGVEKINREKENWRVTCTDGNVYSSAKLVLALPVSTSLQLLESIDNSMPTRSIQEAKMATVVSVFRNGATLPPGFGMLIPEVEKRFTMGTLFSSNMFPGRCPKGHILMETLVGGRRHPERLELSNFDLIKYSLKEIKEILHIKQDPCYTKVLRPWAGIPQPEGGFTKLLEWKSNLMEKTPGLGICGFGWDGIGINDMIKSGFKIGDRITSGHQKDDSVEVKKVYF